jgi:hypothetical protein
MANAECRVELTEMEGYEDPFLTRLQVFDFIRRIRGDNARQPCVTMYIRRMQMNGFIRLTWNSGTKTYSAQAPRAVGTLFAFNNHYEAASLLSSMSITSQFLSDVNKYYGYEAGTPPSYISEDRKRMFSAYALAMCWDPATITAHVAEPNHAPIVKPLFKHVVHPGEDIYKEVIAMDPDDDALTITVTNLPAGATYTSATREINWTPSGGDAGVHVATITADDGTTTTSRPFPMIVKADAPAGPIPAAPTSVTVSLNGNDATVSWTAPGGVSVAKYVIYCDGELIAAVDSGTTSYVYYGLQEGTHTRFDVSLLDTTGAESPAVMASSAYVYVPRP